MSLVQFLPSPDPTFLEFSNRLMSDLRASMGLTPLQLGLALEGAKSYVCFFAHQRGTGRKQELFWRREVRRLGGDYYMATPAMYRN